jgi:NACHT domain-containing protein
MDVSLFTAAGVKAATDLLKDRITRWLDSKGEKTPSELATNIENHVADVNSWSARIQFYGMSFAQSSDTTVPLSFEIPRQFRGLRRPETQLSERDVLSRPNHILLLGGPGYGKTTTLKRLSRLLLDEPSSNGEIDYQVPIVIRLRDLKHEYSLYDELVNILGLKAAVCVVVKSRDTSDSDKQDREGKPEQLIGGVDYRFAVNELLNQSQALLLVDGLDELDRAVRDRADAELETLARGLSNCKMIVTCRSGDYQQHLEGFDVHEICPLTYDQINSIAAHWLKDAAPVFLQSLDAVPYKDLVERPLLLAQLMKVFEDDGTLPRQPAEVYERMIGLLLERWDKERHIARRSKYASFTPDRKARFLAALAYHLTVRIRTKVFSEKLLLDTYAQIHKQFGLPASEGKTVAKELESHNGIIVQGSRTEYELSHFSLQEYLCAEYLVRDSFPERLAEYLRHYPDPVGVAVAISSNPTNWLGSLLLRKNVMLNFTGPSLRAFLARLFIERPTFERSSILGLVAMKLFWACDGDESAASLLEKFTQMDEVWPSLGDALEQFYCATGIRWGRVELKRIASYENRYGLHTQELTVLPEDIVARLLGTAGTKLQCRLQSGVSWVASSGDELLALPRTEYEQAASV